MFYSEVRNVVNRILKDNHPQKKIIFSFFKYFCALGPRLWTTGASEHPGVAL